MSTQLRIDYAEPKYSDTPCDLNPLEEGDMHNFIPFFATYRHFLLVFTQFSLAHVYRYML